MKRKVWEITVLDNPNRAVGGENDIFYTTDTEAFLIFRLTDKDFDPATATLTLVNTSDKSVISETVPVVDKEIEWEMSEDAIVHSGNWQAQLVYTQEKAGKPERYTAPIIQFDIQSHLMTGRQPTLIAIEDWNTFMSTAQGLLAQLEEETDGIFINIAELQQQYRDSEQARADAENVRETNESTRQAEESQRASSEQQREANESLRESSETDRVSAEQNRVTAESERNDLYDLVQQKLENGEFVGEKGDTGDGLEYVWNDTQLGVRKEGETEYVYVDLKGDKGETGAIENLDSSHIVDALGYMPISATDLPEPTWANLQNKPTEFNPTSHTHSIDDVTGLRAELDSVPELTKENVGLGNVDNVKQASKVEHDQLATDFSAHQADDATTSKKGHVQLSNAINSTSQTLAATPNAVKQAYDRANEAFTSASNGKTLVGNAITGVDDSVVIPTDPTFGDLASAIGSISTGKKWASGSDRISSSGLEFTTHTNTGTHNTHLTIGGLSFLPRVIVIYNEGASYPLYTSYTRGARLHNIFNTSIVAIQGGQNITQYIKLTGNAYVNNGGFRLPADSGYSATQGTLVNWIAFE